MKSLLNKIHDNQNDQNLLEKLLDVAESHRTSRVIDRSELLGISVGDVQAKKKSANQNPGGLEKAKGDHESLGGNKDNLRLDTNQTYSAVDTDNHEYESHIIRNFESFSQHKNEGSYANYNIQHDKGKKNILYDDVDDDINVESERFLNNHAEISKKKILKSAIEGTNLKDPYLRYSVNNPSEFDGMSAPKMKKTLLGSKKGVPETDMTQMYKDSANHAKMEHKMHLDGVNMVDEREMNNFDNDEQYYSFAKNTEEATNVISSFSSFSNNNLTAKKPIPALMQSFGVKPNEVVLEFISNWGSPFQIGLSEVELYDCEMNEVSLSEINLTLYRNNNCLNAPTLYNLINDRVATTNPHDMFLLDYDPKRNHYAVHFSFCFDVEIGFIVLWNFNEDVSKGLKGVRISVGERRVFEGDVVQATGKLNNYSRFLIVKTHTELNENTLTKIINKRFVTTKMLSPISNPNLHSLSDNGVHRRIVSNNQETKFPDSSTPKNKLRSKNEMLDKARTPSSMKKSHQHFEKFEAIKLLSNISVESKGKLKSLNTVNSHQEKPFKPQYDKFKPIAINRPKTLFESCNSLLDLVQICGTSKIPTLPIVNGVSFKLLSNWHDKVSIGLNGIEVFNDLGERVPLTRKNVSIQLKNGNTLTHLNEQRLVDNFFNTTDENRHWSYPIEGSLPLSVKLRFDSPQTVAMVRIWNYNCSRIHAARGVKDIIVTNYEDSNLLFASRVRKASGLVTKLRKNFESILFTTDKTILNNIARNDWLYSTLSRKSSTVVQKKIKNCFDEFINQRPITAELEELHNAKQKAISAKLKDHMYGQSTDHKQRGTSPANKILEPQNVVSCRVFKIEVLETWGCLTEFAAVGVEFYNNKGQRIPEEYYTVTTKCKLVGDDSGNLDSDLKAQRPVCLKFKPGEENLIEYVFKSQVPISFIYLYNLCDSNKMSTKGTKRIGLFADSNSLTASEGIYLKKGSNLDFMKKYPQKVTFPVSQIIYNIEPKPSPLMPVSSPTGFTVQFNLKCTFGDPYYIGLNGIEIFDVMGNNVLAKENEAHFRIVADPPGVFILPGMAKDPRVAGNLCKPNPYFDHLDDVWLTPFAKYDKAYNSNILVVEFKNPVTIGMINVWNYSRTASRGVKEIEIYLDDNMIYCGWLNDINERLTSSIVFNEVFLKKRPDHMRMEPISHLPKELTEFYNEGEVLSKRVVDKYLQDTRPATGLHA